ncbi:MAG: dihydrolipoyl dehydrogenase [Proteobacteria bacterium]|nr:dihydrolipoyl dehydrogenase [Pseudomonadota bacterium]
MTRLTIIGGGPGGYTAALRAADLGARVTLITDEPLGGTCLWRGCIPTKTLRASAHTLDLIGRSEEFGLRVEGPAAPDLARLRDRLARVIDVQVRGLDREFKQRHIEVVRGRALLKGPGHIEVRTEDGPARDLDHDRLIIAVGSRPASLPGLKVDGLVVWSSDQALALTEIPGRLLVVGGGAVGSELAAIYGRLGSEVVLVEYLGRLLPWPGVDEDLSAVLLREMKKRRIKVFLEYGVTGLAPDGAYGLKVCLEPAPGAASKKKVWELSVDRVLLSVGRRPNTEGLGLQNAGVATDDAGWIEVDDRLETSVPGVYAVGDVLGPSRVMLAHAASAEGLIATENALGTSGPMTLDYDQIPYAVFTFPEAAGVGLTEAQAADRGPPIRTARFDLRPLGRAQAEGEIAGLVKLIAEADSGRLLGGHIIGAGAGEMIHEVAVALRLGATASDLAATVHAHPTMYEGLNECARLLAGRPIHRA